MVSSENVASPAALRRFKPLEVRYQNKPFRIPPFFNNLKKEERGEYRTLINDDTVELYMCQWMYYEKFNDEQREKYHVFNPFFFASLRLHFFSHIKVAPRRSELGPLFRKIFRKKDTSYLQKNLLILPIHIDKPKHWVLAIIHNPSGAICRKVAPVEVSEEVEEKVDTKMINLTSQLTNFVNFEEASECRILIMDSLISYKKYNKVLTNWHERIIDILRLFLQMAMAENEEEFISSRVRSVVCQSLPQQQNRTDCGIYMMAYAEYFTNYNTEWMNLPTSQLEYLKMDPDAATLLSSDEPRHRLEQLLEHLTTKE